LAQAVGAVTGWVARQVPSDWQTPSPQSASRVQRPVPPGPTLQSSLWGSHTGSAFWSTHAASSKQTAKAASFPRPIPHLPELRQQGGAQAAGRQPAGRPSGNTPQNPPIYDCLVKNALTVLTRHLDTANRF
jgi:hypothetical protein